MLLLLLYTKVRDWEHFARHPPPRPHPPMLRMIRRASVNMNLKTEWKYYSYLVEISVKLLISAENVSYNPNLAEISVKLLISAENVSYNPNSAKILVKQLVSV